MQVDRVIALDGALGNDLVACLLDQPLFVGEGAEQLSLTAEEWACARNWVQRTGRAIRLKSGTASAQPVVGG